jgi:hypothetical protein
MSPGWFRYAEQDGKGAISPNMLKQFADLWQKLHKLQNNLSFNKTTMTAANKAVMEKKQEEWQLTDQQDLEQPKVLANRLRLACRHVSQALGKKTSPQWISMIFGEKKPGEEEKEENGEKEEEEHEKEEAENGEEEEEEEVEES